MSPRPPAGWTRWGLIATNLAMGVALVGLAWSAYRGIDHASMALARGQAELLFQAVQRALRDEQGPPSEETLGRILETYRASGLRWIALLEHSGEPMVEVGVRQAPLLSWPLPEPLGTPGEGPARLVELASAYRFFGRLPPPARRADPPRRGPAPGPPRPQADDDPRDPQPGPTIVIDFEASTVDDLENRAGLTLLIGTASALMLTVVALVLWRQAAERERDQRLLEQRKRLSALGEMTAVLAHEIRNPLTSLKGNAEILAELAEGNGDREATSRKARRVVQEIRRLETLVEHLLDFSRSGPVERRPVDPAALLREVAEEIGDPRLRQSLEEAPSAWSLDGLRLRQVLTNLVRNGLQASPDGLPVEVRMSAGRRGGPLTISVRDYGEGLPAGEEERIFEPFFTTRSTGTGLGLAVSRRIVEMHGGSIVGRNHPKGGAELVVRIPEA